MSEYRVTEQGIIAWVENTSEGQEAWEDHHGGSISDYLADYSDYENILDLLAGDLGYPGDKETNAPGSEIDWYSLLLQIDDNGQIVLSASLTHALSELSEEERATKGDEISVIEATTLEEALTNAIKQYPADGAVSALCRKALAGLQI
jgi:hypothetical protein